MTVLILALTLVGVLTVWHVLSTYLQVARGARRYVMAERWDKALVKEFKQRIEDPDGRGYYFWKSWLDREHKAEFMGGRTLEEVLGRYLIGVTSPEVDAYRALPAKRRELVRSGLGSLLPTVAAVLALIFL